MIVWLLINASGPLSRKLHAEYRASDLVPTPYPYVVVQPNSHQNIHNGRDLVSILHLPIRDVGLELLCVLPHRDVDVHFQRSVLNWKQNRR